MAVLGKDLFDLGRPDTHTKIQFGDRGYWVELNADCLPYGTILTEILNFQMEDYCAKLATVEQAVAARNRAQLSRPLWELMDAFTALPLYRLYVEEPWTAEPTFSINCLEPVWTW